MAMDAGDATHLYGQAILTAVDRLQASGKILPQHQAQLCLAIHAAVEEAFDLPELRGHALGFLAQLSERTHAALAAQDGRLRPIEISPLDWLSRCDE